VEARKNHGVSIFAFNIFLLYLKRINLEGENLLRYSVPIYESMRAYLKENTLRLHMPGHIGGRGIKSDLISGIGAIDFTEIAGLDDFHSSTEAIQESSRLIAEAYGAYESLFLVNGASSGIHSIFLGLLREGDKVLIPRNAHRSFFAALVISGCRPVYLPVQYDAYWGIPQAISWESIETMRAANPDLKAVFLCTPSYYGTCMDLTDISRLLDKHSIPLIIDEAHGSHFAFHPDYPPTALKQGAAAAINGLHKTLPVLNQGACLHLAKKCPHKDRIKMARSLLTTTSPSYPLLASMDLARALMQTEGTLLLDKALNLSQEYKFKLNQIKGISVLDYSRTGIEVDPLKVVILLNKLDIDGFSFEGILRERFKIQIEMAESHLILAMFSCFHEREEWERFYQAVNKICAQYYNPAKKLVPLPKAPPSKVVLSPRQAFNAADVRVRLEEAVGKVSAEMVVPYPPGIPCLLPGEEISPELYDYLCYLRSTGQHIQGPSDAELKYINIIESI